MAKDGVEAARNARKRFTKQCKRLQIFDGDGGDTGSGSVTREQADHLRTTLPTEQIVAMAKLQDKAAFIVRAHDLMRMPFLRRAVHLDLTMLPCVCLSACLPASLLACRRP